MEASPPKATQANVPGEDRPLVKKPGTAESRPRRKSPAGGEQTIAEATQRQQAELDSGDLAAVGTAQEDPLASADNQAASSNSPKVGDKDSRLPGLPSFEQLK